MGGHKKIASTYVAALFSTSLVMLMTGVLLLFVFNARILGDHIKKNVGFTVIVKENAQEVEVKRFGKILDMQAYVSKVKYIGKDEAAEKFKEDMGEDFLDILGYNPLLSSFEIEVKQNYANNDSLSIIQKQLMQNDIVYEVSYQKSMMQKISRNLSKIGLAMFVVCAIFLLIAIVLIRNTISQFIYSKRFDIKTMQLVGAKSSYVAKPFIIDGIMLGFWGALVADLIIVILVYFLQQQFGSLVYLFDLDVIKLVLLTVVFLGVVLSFFSTIFSVRRFLVKNVNDFYV